MNYYDLTTETVKEHLENKLLILRVGSVEQHGPHLPFSVDIDIPTGIAKEIAQKNEVILLPPVCYAARSIPHSGGGSDFPGTIYISGDILIRYLYDILKGYCRLGAKKILVLNGHYENEAFILEALEQLKEQNFLEGKEIYAFSWWDLVTEEFIEAHHPRVFYGWHAEHAAIFETSLMMYFRPETVRTDQFLKNDNPPDVGIYKYPTPKHITKSRGVLSSSEGSSSAFGKLTMEEIYKGLKKHLNLS